MAPTTSHRTLHRHRGGSANRTFRPETRLGPERGPDRARSRSARFGEIQVTYLEHPKVELDTDFDAYDRPVDSLRFLVVLEGEVTLRHDDAAAALARRDAALILGTAPVRYSSLGPTRVIICDIAADHSGVTAVPRTAPFVVGRADTAVPCALGAFLVDLLRQDAQHMTPIARAQVGDVLRTLISSTVMSMAVAGCSGWDLRRQRLAALRHIATRYADPELSSASVAEYLGLSRRSLQRLFEDEDRTVAQRIQEIRTQHAMARLRDRRFSGVPLSEIATLAGFGSTVAMRRAVQEATGLTPTDVRREFLLAEAR